MARIQQVYTLVASFSNIQSLTVSMMNEDDLGKRYKKMKVGEFVKLVTVICLGRLQLPDFMPWNVSIYTEVFGQLLRQAGGGP